MGKLFLLLYVSMNDFMWMYDYIKYDIIMCWWLYIVCLNDNVLILLIFEDIMNIIMMIYFYI